MTDLTAMTTALLDAAKKAGADTADAIATQGTSISINVLSGKLEHAERAESVEIGLRVLIGKRQACVSASDSSAATIVTVAERAVEMAKLAPEDPYVGLAEADQLAGRLPFQGQAHTGSRKGDQDVGFVEVVVDLHRLAERSHRPDRSSEGHVHGGAVELEVNQCIRATA